VEDYMEIQIEEKRLEELEDIEMKYAKPMNVYLTGKQFADIRKIKKEHDVSYSSIVREGLDMALAKYAKTGKLNKVT
jgi:hypothetical protein